MNQEIIVLVGISGSGKSTWAADHIEKNPNYIRINRDSIRHQITGSDKNILSRDKEKLVTKIQDEQIRTALFSSYNVIIDNTHLRLKYISEIVNKYNHLADIKIKIFSDNLYKCQERVIKRDGVSTKVDYIEKQYNQFKNLKITKEIFPKLEKEYTQNTDLKYLDRCIICDLDGTLSLYDSNKKSPYNRDFENDEINTSIETLLKLYSSSIKNSHIFFFSGRNGKYRNQTIEFLTKNLFLPEDFTLIMRDENDQRRDSIVKEEMFIKYIKDQFYIDGVFDDRLQVLEELWWKLGLSTFNVNKNNIRF